MTANYKKAKEQILQKMESELPDTLVYHTLEHTTVYVLPTVTTFCRDFGLSATDQLLVKTAALFHDSGYISQYSDNEAIGISYAEALLPDCGYLPQEIKKIAEIILATRMPQHPTSILGEILCDADLATLGMPEFFETSLMLRREIIINLHPVNLRKWLCDQCSFLHRHQYFTLTARNRFDAEKKSNIDQLEDLLHTCGESE